MTRADNAVGNADPAASPATADRGVPPGDAKAGSATRPPSDRQRWRVLAILSALMGFASISTDFYLPALPTMASSLGSDPGTIELTISSYLIGFSLGQLFWGPIGDRFGRRIPIALGIALFVIGSAGCAMSGSAEAIIGWRVVQAVGACAGVVLARAMVRDLYSGSRAAQMMSTLMVVMAIAPLLGPILGGQILALSGWRAIFWTLVGVGLLTLVALFSLPETLPRERRNGQSMARAFAGYGPLLRQRRLLGYAGAGGFFYGAMFAYIAGTPSAYITYHHVPPQLYGLLFGAGVIGVMAANLVNARLAVRVGSDMLLLWGTGGAGLSGIGLAIAAGTGWGGLVGLVVPALLFISAAGFVVANSIAGALSGFPERAGAVSALVGSVQYGSGIFGSALVGIFADGTPWPMGWVVALGGIGSFLCTRLLIRPRPR